MKTKLLFFSLVLSSFMCLSQTKAIPDVNFERAIIDFSLDDILDGIVQNGSKI